MSVQALDIYLDGEKVASNVPVDQTNSSWEATLPPVRTGYNRTVKFVPSGGGESYTTLISFGYVLLCAGQVSAQVDSPPPTESPLPVPCLLHSSQPHQPGAGNEGYATAGTITVTAKADGLGERRGSRAASLNPMNAPRLDLNHQRRTSPNTHIFKGNEKVIWASYTRNSTIGI